MLRCLASMTNLKAVQNQTSTDCLAAVIRYHQETKHHFFRYARALGYLDWANQPDPFRRFAGAPVLPLPLLEPDLPPRSPAYADLYRGGAVPSVPLSIPSLSRFLELTLALSAWKQVGDVRWPLRMNPSSGNLHPTEGYLLLGPMDGAGQQPCLYHYAPKEHALERRAVFPAEPHASLMAPFPPGAFLFGLTSVHWREAWKYGERAFRYCQHDAGHAIGAARIAAAALGWKAALLDGVSDDQIVTLLGLGRSEDFRDAEGEHPDCLLVVWPGAPAAGAAAAPPDLPLSLEADAVEALARGEWHGRANRLSRDEPVPWEIIDEVAAASWKNSHESRRLAWEAAEGGEGLPVPEGGVRPAVPVAPVTAGQIIRQRRSAVAFDGKTSITGESFYGMMQRVLPRCDRPVSRRPMPWDVVAWSPRIHLAIFVHRVDGVPPGLYCLVRDPGRARALRDAMSADFHWAPAKGCPADLPLYQLVEGDARRLAAQVSCHQEIAGDSAFSLGMLAEFESSLKQDGPWFYRRLFWESGIVGQVLYLEAEAAGVRATGIGCFFDDPVHEVLGLKDLAFQSLYHFTTGGPVEDHRLTTLPPYPRERYTNQGQR